MIVRIVIEFDGEYAEDEAATALDDVHQLFMKSNPLDEPYIYKEEKAPSSHISEVLHRVKALHPPKFTHKCFDWDGMEINEFDQEFNACTCRFLPVELEEK